MWPGVPQTNSSSRSASICVRVDTELAGGLGDRDARAGAAATAPCRAGARDAASPSRRSTCCRPPRTAHAGASDRDVSSTEAAPARADAWCARATARSAERTASTSSGGDTATACVPRADDVALGRAAAVRHLDLGPLLVDLGGALGGAAQRVSAPVAHAHDGGALGLGQLRLEGHLGHVVGRDGIRPRPALATDGALDPAEPEHARRRRGRGRSR